MLRSYCINTCVWHSQLALVTMTLVSDVENGKKQSIVFSHVNFLPHHYNVMIC